MVARSYRCPECESVFSCMHHPSREADPVPRFCPLCGYDTVNEPPRETLSTPHIGRSNVVRAVDETYRGMEAGSEIRAQMAQEQFGISAEEASGIKITNMRDNLREGETAAMPVSNPVSQFMAQHPGAPVGYNAGSDGLGYSQVAHTGADPNAGLKAMLQVREEHANNAARVTGVVGSPYTTDRPAAETLVPGYRRRA